MVALWLALPAPLWADFQVRPHLGTGVANRDMGVVRHVGGRLLLKAGGSKRYGLEATHFFGDDRFYALGIILERTQGRAFNMAIGTVGYFGFGEDGNPVGISTSLGWESPASRWRPFIAFRTDLVLTKNPVTITSISVGISP